MYDMKNNRQLCWDFEIVDQSQGICLRQHQPERKNVAFVADEDWEGSHCGYSRILKTPDGIRFYYRADNIDFSTYTFTHTPYVCMAESKDGKAFTKPALCRFAHKDSKDNNIAMCFDRYFDNFSVFYDENPDCPADEKYKALEGREIKAADGTSFANGASSRRRLLYYKSANGIDFEYVRELDINGFFDSYNIGFWDKETQQYFVYYRNFHDVERQWPDHSFDWRDPRARRDIRVTTSRDFVNWTQGQELSYGENAPDFQLYINNVQRYERASGWFIGRPTRYMDRAGSPKNFEHLTWNNDDSRKRLIQARGREGSAVTDCMLMVSRDGRHFNRSNEPFLPNYLENQQNWLYGDCFMTYGMLETEADFPGEPTELSMYCGEGGKNYPTRFRRYTIRMDGFLSWHADYEGGMVLTKPVTFSGDSLKINFATSAVGYLKITLCDVNGNELEGYHSGELFGNSLARPVDFDKSLAELKGKELRMKFEFSSCDLYSFIFE